MGFTHDLWYEAETLEDIELYFKNHYELNLVYDDILIEDAVEFMHKLSFLWPNAKYRDEIIEKIKSNTNKGDDIEKLEQEYLEAFYEDNTILYFNAAVNLICLEDWEFGINEDQGIVYILLNSRLDLPYNSLGTLNEIASEFSSLDKYKMIIVYKYGARRPYDQK